MHKPQTIYIAGVARSGTSWLGQIFNSSPNVKFKFQPFFSYEFKNRVNEDSTKAEFKSLLRDMYKKDSEFLDQIDKKKSGEYPKFNKNDFLTHLVFKESRYQNIIEPIMRKCPQMKLIGIIRNPNAVLNSWMKNIKEFPKGSNPLKEWRYGECKNQGHEDFFGYYKWKEVANLYLDLQQKWPKRVFILSYEDLVENPRQCTQNMFEFSSLNYTAVTEDFLKKSTELHLDTPYAVFKDRKVAIQWKDELPAYITEEIKNDLVGTRLEKFLK